MSRPLADLIGQTFTRLTVTAYGGIIDGESQWLCRCECDGKIIPVTNGRLKSGNTRSCGCLKLEKLAERSTKHGHSYAGGYTPTYSTWAAMIQRCTNPAVEYYADYGGRGITVCERWLDFRNFLADMGEKPKGMSIDRIDNERGYEPGNCRWATPRQQAAHKRNSRLLTFRGETHCVTEWSRILGIHQATLNDRLHSGWTVDDALGIPVNRAKFRH